MTKNELTLTVTLAKESFAKTFASFEGSELFERRNGKWSRAENLQHLILAVKPLVLAYGLPGFVLQILFGEANRPSRSYDEMVAKYKKKLAEGGKASAPFIPKPIKTGSNKTQLVENFNNMHNRFIKKIGGWDEHQLDRYILPHPLLGKITLREMICFTALHIAHHEQAIKN